MCLHVFDTMRILLVEDHTVLREGVKSLLNTFPGITDIDEATTGQEALALIRKQKYKLVFLDLSLPDISGLEVLQRINDTGIHCRIAILSLHPEEQYASRAFKLGAIGYINKNSSFEDLKLAISKLLDGQMYISSGYAEKLAFDDDLVSLPHEKLSDRELEVMVMIARGESLSDIANKLCVADKTVSTYRSRILEKMLCSSNAELTMYAIKNGLIQ